MEKKIKRANHKYNCDKCNGNGYIKIYDMVIQCGKCKSQGVLTLEEPTVEELEEMVKSARLQ